MTGEQRILDSLETLREQQATLTERVSNLIRQYEERHRDHEARLRRLERSDQYQSGVARVVRLLLVPVIVAAMTAVLMRYLGAS